MNTTDAEEGFTTYLWDWRADSSVLGNYNRAAQRSESANTVSVLQMER
jgi:hypothetical protein